MVLEVQQKTLTYNSNGPAPTRSDTKPNCIFNKKGVTDVINEPVNTAAPENVNKDLYENLTKFLENNNITMSPHELDEIILKVGGKSKAELLNIEQSEINRLTEIIETSIAVLKNKNIEINATSIINMSKHLKIMVDNDWSLKSAVNDVENNSNQESMADKLKRVWPGVFTADYNFSDPANKEQIKEYVQDYIRLYNKTEKLRNTDWAKMLACSKNDNERDVFDGILKEIDPQYRAKFVQSWLYSYEKDENRINAANRVDILGATEDTSDEDTQFITHLVRSNQNETGIVESDNVIYETVNKFFEEKDIKELINKVEEQGIESLDDKERELYTQWTHYQSIIKGSYTGTVANQNVDTEFKESHLRDFVNPQIYNYGEDTYKEIIEYVKSYYENHKDEFNMDLASFESLMNNATEGNYTHVVNNEPLTPPTVGSAGSNSSSADTPVKGGFGFDQRTETRPADVSIVLPSTPTDPQITVTRVDCASVEDLNDEEYVKKLFKGNDTFKVIRDIFKCENAYGTKAFKIAFKKFKILPKVAQNLMVSFGNFSVKTVCSLAKTMELFQLKDIKIKVFYPNQCVEEITERKEELLTT